MLEPLRDDRIRAGREALRRSAWAEARDAFEAAVDSGETPEALEGLAAALRLTDDAASSLALRERAFRLYQERGDRRSAARVATSLAVEFSGYRAEFAVGDGWFRRAQRLLDGLEPGPEHVWLKLWEGSVLVHPYASQDVERGWGLAAEGAELGRRLALADATLLGVGLDGLRLVEQGRVAEGMKLLDEAAAAAVAGELPDLDASGNACCYVLTTCERVRDYDRAAQWLERVVDRYEERGLGRFLVFCRNHAIGVMIWRGEWQRADEELDAVLAESTARSLAIAIEAQVRRAELRRLQGRWEEAAESLRHAEGFPPAHLVAAALALDEGAPARAVEAVDRYRRAMPEGGVLLAAAAEALLVRARAKLGETAEARAALARLRPVAEDAATAALRAELLACEGAVAAAEGRFDEARRASEDAVDAFARSGSPYEAARSRLDLADALLALGRDDDAAREARAALEALSRLGAAAAEKRARALLARAGRPTSGEARPDGLSRRQCEVLRLLARGLSNREIGEQLFVSEFTVKRHVADILTRLDLPSRAAAAAYAAQQGLA